MAGHWEHFPHGADIGIRGVGETQAEAYAEAARALTAIAVDPDEVRPARSVAIVCSGSDAEDLLYAWLNALIYEMATKHMLFGRFDVVISGNDLRAVAWGETVVPERHQPTVEAKGATYTMLAVQRQAAAWTAQCVVDV